MSRIHLLCAGWLFLMRSTHCLDGCDTLFRANAPHIKLHIAQCGDGLAAASPLNIATAIYAAKHRYSYSFDILPTEPERSPQWCKVEALKTYARQADYLLFLDNDVLVTSPHPVSAEYLESNGFSFAAPVDGGDEPISCATYRFGLPNASLQVVNQYLRSYEWQEKSRVHDLLNAGIVFLKTNDISLQFLDAWWETGGSWQGGAYLKSSNYHEQRIFNVVAGWPQYQRAVGAFPGRELNGMEMGTCMLHYYASRLRLNDARLALQIGQRALLRYRSPI